MKQRVGEKIKLTSFNDLMGIPEGESSIEIEIKRIVPFQNHPFKVKDDEKMEELIESIRLQGILTPVLVRPDDTDGYEMISGHRRMHAAQRLGLETIPALVKEMTDTFKAVYDILDISELSVEKKNSLANDILVKVVLPEVPTRKGKNPVKLSLKPTKDTTPLIKRIWIKS